MMQTEKKTVVVRLQVEFTEDEFALLLKRTGDWVPGAEAEWVHALVMRSLNRKPRKAKAEAGQ